VRRVTSGRQNAGAAVVGAEPTFAVVEAQGADPRSGAGCRQRAADLPMRERVSRGRARVFLHNSGGGLTDGGREAEGERGCEYEGM
jgi:hypothetical protein